MPVWTSDELTTIGAAEEVRIASLRSDATLRTPVIVWVVRHGDDIYIRSVNGRDAAWFRGTQARHEGRIWTGGVEKDVTFVEETDTRINDEIDGAYRAKYHRYPSIVPHIVNPQARSATMKLVPR
jgi:hypothetical protein